MKTFKDFLSETPKLFDVASTKYLNPLANNIRSHIKSNHEDSVHIGNSEEGTYHQLGGDKPIYYHMVGGNPREIALIDKNTGVQSFAAKGDGGNSLHNKNFMKYHAKTNGFVVSDKLQSKGSKKLWVDLVKIPENKFTVYHHDGHDLNKVNLQYLNDKENSIWGNSDENKNHRMILKYDE